MKILSLERLEAQLKACHCSFVFSKIKVSQNNYSLHIENNDLFQCFSALFIKNQTAFVLYTSRLLLYLRYNVSHLRRFTFKCCHSFYFFFFFFFNKRLCLCFCAAISACPGSPVFWGPWWTWPRAPWQNIWGLEQSAAAAKCKSSSEPFALKNIYEQFKLILILNWASEDTSPLCQRSSDWLPLAGRRFKQQVSGTCVLMATPVCLIRNRSILSTYRSKNRKNYQNLVWVCSTQTKMARF